MKENIMARVFAKRFDVYKEEIVKTGNSGYFIYKNTVYYGNRFFVFFRSAQTEALSINKFKSPTTNETI